MQTVNLLWNVLTSNKKWMQGQMFSILPFLSFETGVGSWNIFRSYVCFIGDAINKVTTLIAMMITNTGLKDGMELCKHYFVGYKILWGSFLKRFSGLSPFSETRTRPANEWLRLTVLYSTTLLATVVVVVVRSTFVLLNRSDQCEYYRQEI